MEGMTADGAKPEICGKETELRVLEGELQCMFNVAFPGPFQTFISIDMLINFCELETTCRIM